MLPARPHRAYSLATLLALVGAGILIRWWLAARPLWVDEEMLALNARDRTFAELAGPLWLNQTVPLGWLALERLVLIALGTGERAARLLTVLFGIGTLGAAVWTGRRFMTAAGAAVLVLLCSIAPWLVFFTLELKHYSADMCAALLLPALAAWTIDAGNQGERLTSRVAIWWTAASVGQWFSNGALFVAPACAIVLLAESWRRRERRAIVSVLLGGGAWLASFALNYYVVLRHALANRYLQTYWEFAFPQAGSIAAALQWLLQQFEAVAVKPVGSTLWILFWIAAGGGFLFAIATGRRVGILFALVPVSAAALAFGHVVPIFERLTLWMVPALFVGVALCADAAVVLARRKRLRPAALAAAIAAGVATSIVCADLTREGIDALRTRPQSNYGLDDRRSVRFVLASHRPGDGVMTTHFGLAAIWWYGGVDLSGSERGASLPDGTPLLEMGHTASGPACQGLDSALSGRSRVVAYAGFRLNVLPDGFDELVWTELARRGTVVTYREFAEESRIAIVDLKEHAAEQQAIPARPHWAAGQTVTAPAGCVTVARAGRW